jgi:hypothetical protein
LLGETISPVTVFSFLVIMAGIVVANFSMLKTLFPRA